MTDSTDTETTEPMGDPAEAVTETTEPEATASTDAEDQGDTDTHDDRQDRDAAKYRRRLRETEAERDSLATRVEALQRAAIEVQAAAEIKPAALWASGVQLAELLNDDGTVDTGKVAAACNAARETLGLGPRTRNHVRREGSIPSDASATGGRDAMVDIVMGRNRD